MHFHITSFKIDNFTFVVLVIRRLGSPDERGPLYSACIWPGYVSWKVQVCMFYSKLLRDEFWPDVVCILLQRDLSQKCWTSCLSWGEAKPTLYCVSRLACDEKLDCGQAQVVRCVETWKTSILDRNMDCKIPWNCGFAFLSVKHLSFKRMIWWNKRARPWVYLFMGTNLKVNLLSV